ncbi:ATP-binding cassette domain-containing protein [bacterium]|nr:ATP-binding cassette domain-containing protein [bacterium]
MSPVMLQATGIVQRFDEGTGDEHEVLHGVDLSLFKDEIIGMIGPTGSGKSVLLKTLAGVLPPSEGEVSSSLQEGEEISFMFQEGALFDSLSVLDNVAFPLVRGRVPCAALPYAERTEVCDQVAAVLERVGLAAHSHKFPAQLSGGMRRRVSLARALVNEPDIALLDDPTSGLDPVASSVIMNLIEELHQSFDTAMILVSHDLRRLFPICSRVVALFQGEIVFRGAVADLANPSAESPTVESLFVPCKDLLRQFVACRYDFSDSGLSSVSQAYKEEISS